MYNPSQTDNPTVTHFTPQESPGVQTGGRTSFGGGSAIGSAISTIGGLIDNWANRRHERKLQQMQIAENEKNKQWQEDMYIKYESPQAQAQQMREAGLNPAGNVSSQQVGSASSSPIPQGASSSFGSAIAQGAQMYLQNRHQDRLFKLQQEAQAHSMRNDLYKNMQEDFRIAMSYDELQKKKEMYNEQINAMKVDNADKQIYHNMLEAAFNDGVNRFKDEHEAHTKNMSVQDSIIAFNNAKTAVEKKNEAFVVAQTIAKQLEAQLIRINTKEAGKESKRNDDRFLHEQTIQAHEARTMKFAREAGATQQQLDELRLEYSKLENELYKNGINGDNWRLAVDKGISHISGALAFILGGNHHNTGPLPVDVYDGWNTNHTN